MYPLRNNILITQQEKDNSTESGIILTKDYSTGNKPAVVQKVGPDTEYLKVGNVVVVQWSKAIPVEYNGAEAALISEEFVEAIY